MAQVLALPLPNLSNPPKVDSEVTRFFIVPWTAGVRPSWTVSAVTSALRNHAQGQFQSTSLLCDKLGEDDEIPGTLEKRVNTTLKAPFVVKSDNVSRNDEVVDVWKRIAPYAELYQFLSSYVMMGVGIGTIDWDTEVVPWMPRFRALPTEFLRYDQTQRCYFYNCALGDVRVTPGDGKWVMMTKGDRGFLYGAVRALGGLWISKAFNSRDWSRYNEKHGNPILKASIPHVTLDAEKKAFIDQVRQIGSEGVVGCPTGIGEGELHYDLELVEPTSRSYESFRLLNERIDRKIQIQLLGNNIGTEVASTGSNRAAAETAQAGLDLYKGKVDSEMLGTVLQEQLLRPFIALNYGDDEVPYPCYDLEPKEDVLAKASTRKALGDALISLKSAGYRVKDENLATIAAEYGLQLEPIPTNGGPNG